MTKERTVELLEDIKPSELRLKQAGYLLSLPRDMENIRAVSYGEKVATSTTGDNTANTVIRELDRDTELKAEIAELKAKLDLYDEWLKCLDMDQRKLARSIWIDGHSSEWIALNMNEEPATIRSRKRRIIEKLSETEIVVMTELEKHTMR